MVILCHTKLWILPINPLKPAQNQKIAPATHEKPELFACTEESAHEIFECPISSLSFLLPFSTLQPLNHKTPTHKPTKLRRKTINEQTYQRTGLPTNKTTNSPSHASQRLIPKNYLHHAIPVLSPGPPGHLTTPSNHPRKPHPQNDNNASSHAHGLLRKPAAQPSYT